MAVSRPTTDDLVGWIKPQSAPSDETLAVYDEAMDSALDYIESRINLPSTVDGSAESNANYPQRIRTAILLTAARLAKRSTSPEGVAGMSDLGAVVRVLPADPDVERLIMRFLKLDGFY
jgi:hypothetical protein